MQVQKSKRALSSRDFARCCARIADEKKATDIIIYNISKISSIADYFVLATGESPPQLRAIAREIERAAKTHQVTHFHDEGFTAGGWLLLDYGDCVIHLFEPELRSYYALELLWGDAPKVKM